MFKESEILFRGLGKKFGMSHWNLDYITEMDGDTECLTYVYGPSKVRQFKEGYDLKGYNAFNLVKGHRLKIFSDIKIPTPQSWKTTKIPKIVLLIAGSAGTGAIPHYHKEYANILIHGRKRWICFDGAGNKDIHNSFVEYFKKKCIVAYGNKDKWNGERSQYHSLPETEWLKKDYSAELQDYKDGGGIVLDFIQEAGDLILLPDGCSHTTINLEESLAFANTMTYSDVQDLIKL